MAASAIFGRLEVKAGKDGGVGRFLGGRIALEMSPGAEAGRNEAAALFAANGDSSSDSSRMLANFGTESSFILSAEPFPLSCSTFSFVVDFLCATLFLVAGLLAGVEVTSTQDSEDGFGNNVGRSGVEDGLGMLDLREIGKDISSLGGIPSVKASPCSTEVEDGL